MRSRISLMMFILAVAVIVSLPLDDVTHASADSIPVIQINMDGENSRITEDTEISRDIEFGGHLEIAEDVVVVIRQGATVTISGDAVCKGTLIVGQGAALRITGSLENKGLLTVTGTVFQKADVTVTGSLSNMGAMHIDEYGVLKGDIVSSEDSVLSVSGRVDGDIHVSGTLDLKGRVSGIIVMGSEGSSLRFLGVSSSAYVKVSIDGKSYADVSIHPYQGHSLRGLILTCVFDGKDAFADLSGQVSSDPVSVDDTGRSIISCSGHISVAGRLILERGIDLKMSGDVIVGGALSAMYKETSVKVSGVTKVTGHIDSVNTLDVNGRLDAGHVVMIDEHGEYHRYTKAVATEGWSTSTWINVLLVAAIIVVCAMIIALVATDPRYLRGSSESDAPTKDSQEVIDHNRSR